MWQRTSLVGALILLVLLRGPSLMSRAWSNAGMVTLFTHVLTTAPDELSFQAERLLHRAAAWDSENHGAHRGLGWALAVQGKEEKAGAEWRVGGFTVQDFIARGEQARRAKQYDESMVWYRRASWLEPGLGHCSADGGSAAMNHDRPHADGLHEDNVQQEVSHRHFVLHDASAKLDHGDLVAELADPRQCLDQDIGLLDGFFQGLPPGCNPSIGRQGG